MVSGQLDIGTAAPPVSAGNGVAVSGGQVSVLDPLLDNLIAKGKPFLDVRAAPTPVKADAVILTDLVTNGTTTVTSAAGKFSPGTKHVVIPGAGVAGAALSTTAAYVSPTQITTGIAATNSASGQRGWYGTDDTAAWQSAVSSGFAFLMAPESGASISDTVPNNWGGVKLLECLSRNLVICQKTEGHIIFFSTSDLQGCVIRGITFQGIGKPTATVSAAANTAIQFEGSRHTEGAGTTNHDQLGIIVDRCSFYDFQSFPVIIANCKSALITRCLVDGAMQGVSYSNCSYSEIADNEIRNLKSIHQDQIAIQIGMYNSVVPSLAHQYMVRVSRNRVYDCTNCCAVLCHDGTWIFVDSNFFINVCAGITAGVDNSAAGANQVVSKVFLTNNVLSGSTDANGGNSQYNGITINGSLANVGLGTADHPIDMIVVDNNYIVGFNAGMQSINNAAINIVGGVTRCRMGRNYLFGNYGVGLQIATVKGAVDIDIDGLEIIDMVPLAGTVYDIAFNQTAPYVVTGSIKNSLFKSAAHTFILSINSGDASGFVWGAGNRVLGTVTNWQTLGGTSPVSVALGARALGNPMADPGVPTISNSGPALGSSRPAPTVTGNDAVMRISFGSGTGPATGQAVQVNFGKAFKTAPVAVILSPHTAAAAALQAYVATADITVGAFLVSLGAAPPAGQAATAFPFSVIVIGGMPSS